MSEREPMTEEELQRCGDFAAEQFGAEGYWLERLLAEVQRLREHVCSVDIEALPSPDSVPPEVRELAARDYKRINRHR